MHFEKFDDDGFNLFEAEISENIFDLIDLSIEYSGGLVNGTKEGKGHHYDKISGEFYSGGYQKGMRHGFGMLWFGPRS